MSAYGQLLTGYSTAKSAEPRTLDSALSSSDRESPYEAFFSEDNRPLPKTAESKIIPVLTPAPLPFGILTRASREAVGGGSEQGNGDSPPVDLQADHLEHNEGTQTIKASGNVMLEQDGRILRADEITYNLKTDTVQARGHVVLNERNGDVYYSDMVELQDKMKNGFVQGLKSYLADGSRFTAREGRRKDGRKTSMSEASYTPCEPCKENPEKPPVWQIKASKITHDKDESRVSYRHARFEVSGVPVMYTPYFSHPDGTIKRKSGFLAPQAGYRSRIGAFLTNRYYWDVAPDKDLTLGLMLASNEDPLFLAEWRQRWDDAALELSGGLTNSTRLRRSGALNIVEDKELRGHIKGKGRWDINDKWRSGLNIEWASDDQYMRQYKFSSRNVFENELYVERFSGRNYAAGRLLTFQDTRVGEDQADQPEILPEIMARFQGEPDSVPLIGGSWRAEGSFLGLRRSGDAPDMNRLSMNMGWGRRLVSDLGLLTQIDASLRTDLYNARDRAIATAGSGRSRDTREARVFPQFNIKSSYPVSKDFVDMEAQAVIEPVLSLTIAPNIKVSDNIPNEDSKDVQIDANNIFEPNRFPGFDRVEDSSRVTYGLRTGLYGYSGNYADVFLGQSRRLNDRSNPFPEGSGLDQRNSAIVGQVSGGYDNRYNLNYRFQLSGNNVSSQRHEIDAYANWNRFRLSSRYLFAKALEGTVIDKSREQLQSTAYYNLTSEWGVKAGGTMDLGERPGLRRAYFGLDYFGQCFSWSLTGQRNLTDDISGVSNTDILFRIGLKNIGEFQRTGLRLEQNKKE